MRQPRDCPNGASVGRVAPRSQFLRLDQAIANGIKSITRRLWNRMVGDDIRLTAAEFARLSEAFFTEIERKFA
jgi:hypothetical protein